MIKSKDAVHDQSGLSDDDSEDASGGKAAEVNMFERMDVRSGSQRNSHATGNQGQNMRCALQKLLAAGNSGKAAVYLLAALRGKRSGRGGTVQLVDIKTKRPGRGDASGRSMRLLKKPCFIQRGHHIADGRGAHAFFFAKLTRNGLRCHRLSGTDVDFNHRCQHHSVTRTDAHFGRHGFVHHLIGGLLPFYFKAWREDGRYSGFMERIQAIKQKRYGLWPYRW